MSTIRARLVQMEVSPGHPWKNTETILRRIAQARADGIELVVFPELAVPGYLLGDEWERPAFLRECEACTAALCEASHGILAVFGNVGMDWNRRNEDGRVRKYNALFAARDGKLQPPAAGPYPFVIKTLLPNYREFDDSRHFYDLRKLALEEKKDPAAIVGPIRANGLTLGGLICEDAWDADYNLSPLAILSQEPVSLYVNISASPFTRSKANKRHRVLSGWARRLGRPFLYVNNVGIQNNGKTVYTFDGASCVYDGQGRRIAAAPQFEEALLDVTLPLHGQTPAPELVAPAEDGIDTLCRAIEYGSGKFLNLCRADKVVVGLSGGIDSAVAACLYHRLVGPDNLLLVNMPGPFTSPTTRSLADKLAANLGCHYAVLPIAEGVEVTRRQIHGLELRNAQGSMRRLSAEGIVFENIQSRDRGSRLLAALAASFGGVFTCNANKSEATVGYTTLYGDLCGFLANLADVWKTEIYELARHLNERLYDQPVIPDGIFRIPPSAELSTAQAVDEGKGDPIVYPYHDLLFRTWVERWNRATPEDNLEWYLEGTLEKNIGYPGRVADLLPTPAAFVADLERWWNQYQGLGLAKRIQAPPILAVTRRAFGFDHREAQTGPLYTRRYHELKQKALEQPRP